MKNDLIDAMSKSIGKDVAVFQKFVLEYKKYNNTLFSFVEGEDFCYYNPRIRQRVNPEDIIYYKCEGKSNVIGVYNLIKKKLQIRNNNTMMFFVDRDYNFDKVPKEIYITDYYAIENFYLNENTVKNILENFMEMNTHSKNYKQSLNFYKKTYAEYSIFAVKLNSFYYTIRKHEKLNGLPRANFGILKFSKFIEKDSLDNFLMKQISYERLLKMYTISYDIPIQSFQENELLFNETDHTNFRGKFELEFLQWILNKIRISIKEGNLDFDKDKVCKYDFHTDAMKVLSTYAYTPKSLYEYIDQNGCKNIEKIIYTDVS